MRVCRFFVDLAEGTTGRTGGGIHEQGRPRKGSEKGLAPLPVRKRLQSPPAMAGLERAG
jgi:hypothetical protein